jgi:hypothetical protein
MALQSKEKYDPKKVERLEEHLRLYYDKGQPIDFEIIVDGFKVVRRTSDPNMFAMYENFVDADTKSIEILLYTGSSNNNDKRIFYFGEPPKEGLSGVEIDTRVDEQVERRLKEREYDDLKIKNKELLADIKELEEEVEQLEKDKAALEASQSPLKGVLGEVGSSFVESFIRRNPSVVKSIPGGEALAGLIESDNKKREHEEKNPLPEPEVSFQSKSNGNPGASLSDEDQSAITFVSQLKAQFSKDEFDKILLILQTLAEDKSKIELIINHVNIKQT